MMLRSAPNRQDARATGLTGPALAVVLLGALAAAPLALTPAAAQYRTRTEFVPTYSTSTRVKQQVERLNRMAAQKQWDEWLAGYQQLVDDPRDLVIPRDEEFLVGIRYTLHQQLAGLPVTVRQRYRQLYDGEARKVYDKAAEQNSGAGMRDVYARYRFSSYAGKALLWLGNHALDEGHPELARLAYARLAKEPGTGAGVLLRYALAADGAGKPAEARAALERVRKEFAAEPVQLAGQNTTAGEAAGKIAGILKKEAPAPRRAWTAFGGEAGDRQMPAFFGSALKRLWTYDQPTSAEVPRTGGPSVSFSLGYSNRFRFLGFPAARGDRLWIQGPKNLAAVDLATGKATWDQQGWREEGAAPQPQADFRGSRSVYNQSRPLQAAPTVEGDLVVTRIPLQAGERDQYLWPIDLALAAFDARTGRPVWRRVAGGEPRAYYWNLPAVQSGVVFSGINSIKGGINEFSATALDANTGEPIWSTYLGGGSDNFRTTDGSPPVLKDGMLWIESTLYTLSGVDALTGELRVIYRYPPERRLGSRGGFDNSPSVANEAISLVATGGNSIVFAPRWGTDVVALEASTGKLLWSSPKGPGQNTLGSLFAVDQKHAYVCGDYIQAISLADGAREWTWEPQNVSASDMGFAALCGDKVCVTISGKLHVRSAADGREVQVLDLPVEKDDLSGFTSVQAL
ncbi:MAG TPA: PQQ-binding-like beta-propeller repeat protein, partial [Armatimonadota bacterium]|nr:PQQ-binding-like beta-propeller repeat protein [Armatimonadota bacterium]